MKDFTHVQTRKFLKKIKQNKTQLKEEEKKEKIEKLLQQETKMGNSFTLRNFGEV